MGDLPREQNEVMREFFDIMEARAEIERLRQALRQIAIGACGDDPDEKDALTYSEIEAIAMAALSANGEKP